MANKLSEELFAAMDVIIGKRLEAVQKDNTILCTIEDATNAEKGEYIVSYSATKFIAHSDNTKYRAGQNVWVLIPDGDYNQEKIIIGKYTKNTNTPYVWVDPMESFANMTGNVLTGNYDFTELVDSNGDPSPAIGLIANYSVPRDIFTGKPAANTADGQNIRINDPIMINAWSKDWGDNHLKWNTKAENIKHLVGYNRIGITAEFKTAFGSDQPLTGNYGILFVIITNKQIETENKGDGKYVDEKHFIPIFFDSSEMLGNPYNYLDYTLQSAYYDIAPEQGIPVGVHAFFYQNFDFNNGEYPCRTTLINSVNNEEETELVAPNIFVKNITINLGYATDKVDDDTLFLFTTSNDTYSVDNDPYPKDLQARFIYVGDDQGTRFAINNFSDLTDRLKELNSSLKDLAPIIRWYKFNMSEGVSDPRAGDFWEEFYPECETANDPTNNNALTLINGWFNATISGLDNPVNEKFKGILCYNNKFGYYLRSYLMALMFENPGSYHNLPEYKYWLPIWHWWHWTVCQKEYRTFPYNELVDKNPLAEGEERVTSDMILQQWAASDECIKSEELIFTNSANAYDSSRDLVQGLKLEADDPSNGVFNIYEATFSANNMLINPQDEYTTRRVKATFFSVVSGKEEMDQVERLAWYVPRHNTMIKEPVVNRDYQTYNRISLTAAEWAQNQSAYYVDDNKGGYVVTPSFDSNKNYYYKSNEIFINSATEINTLLAQNKITQEEADLFLTRIEEYFIIIDDEVKDLEKYAKAAILYYHIKPEYKDSRQNNTILATAYRYKRIYGENSENAKFTPTFGTRGTNGTDYTLVLGMIKEIAITGTFNDPPAWTWAPSNENANNTKTLLIKAQLFDPQDMPIEKENVTYTWSFYAPPQGKIPNGNNVLTDTWELITTANNNNIDSDCVLLQPKAGGLLANWQPGQGFTNYLGVILQCKAKIKGTDTDNNSKVKTEFIGYIIVPMRRSRAYAAMEGPSIIRYDSSGTKPQFSDNGYGIIDNHGQTVYSNRTRLHLSDPLTGMVRSIADKYYPTIEKHKTDDKYHLHPKAMYFHDVNNYIGYIDIDDGNNSYKWAQPLLVLVDPYGNTFLNNWGGALDINYDNNSVMASVLGAGRKTNKNTFTGLLLGDIPDENNVLDPRTGLVGYEDGEQTYGLFDDGTMFLGKSGRAQLKFNGTESTIQNAGYDFGHGIKIDFDGAFSGSTITNSTAISENQNPYIDMKASNGSQVYISTAGSEEKPFFKVKGPNDNDLIHIENDDYYLQTANYPGTEIAPSGLKIDLKNGVFDSKGKLTIVGNSESSITFGNMFKVDGAGNVNLGNLNFVDTNGDYLKVDGATTQATNIKPQWMTFVTDVDGIIWRGTAGVTAQITSTATVYYSYPTQTTATVTGQLRTQTMGVPSVSNSAPYPQTSGISGASDNITVDSTWTDLGWDGWADIGGVTNYARYRDWGKTLYVSGVVNGTSWASGSTLYTATWTGSTDVPVVKGIKLKITKLSMWALTNTTATMTTTVLAETSSQTEYDNYGNSR